MVYGRRHGGINPPLPHSSAKLLARCPLNYPLGCDNQSIDGEKIREKAKKGLEKIDEINLYRLDPPFEPISKLRPKKMDKAQE